MIALKPENCRGCGECVKVCPHRVWEMEAGQARLAAEERCIECGACRLNCPHDAITVTKGTGCLVAIIREDILKIDRPGCGCDSGCGC